jgi:hypothetical protein
VPHFNLIAHLISMPAKTEMSNGDSQRVQSSQVRTLSPFRPESSLTELLLKATGGKEMSSSGFAPRAQSAGDRNHASNQNSSGVNNQQGYGKSDGSKGK